MPTWMESRSSRLSLLRACVPCVRASYSQDWTGAFKQVRSTTFVHPVSHNWTGAAAKGFVTGLGCALLAEDGKQASKQVVSQEVTGSCLRLFLLSGTSLAIVATPEVCSYTSVPPGYEVASSSLAPVLHPSGIACSTLHLSYCQPSSLRERRSDEQQQQQQQQ
jgi:hypothetical protein